MSEVERPYKRLSPLTPLVRSAVLLLAGLASFWDNLLSGEVGFLGWGVLALLVAGLVYGAASWLRTKYWIEADELRVDTGVLTRQSRRIRVDRLQGIDIVQPLVARVLGLAELRMDVAGGQSGEGSLAFLPLREAQDLRETLLARRDAVRSGEGPVPDRDPAEAPQDGSASARETVPREQVIARLDLATLLLSLVLSVETVAFAALGVALVLVFTLVVPFGQIGGVAALVPIVGGFVLTQFRKLTAYYDFTVATTPAGLQVRRGLFERSTQTVALPRVQGVVVSEPWLWRSLGWARLDVAVAGASSPGGDGGPSASTVMPVAPRAVVLALARTLLSSSGSPDPDAVRLTPPPERARWVAPVSRSFLSGGVGDDLVVSREGVLRPRLHAVPHARVQSLQLRQGPWQRRLGLADLQVDSPPGPVRVRLRHRDVGEARVLLERENDESRMARRRLQG